MLCCAAGTRLFGFLAESRGPEDFARPLFVVASLFLLAPVVAPSNYVLALVAFLLFEGVVGCYFPALGTLKSKIVPDAQRSTIYNIFRVPLNVLVLLVLLSKLPTQTVFRRVGVTPIVGGHIATHALRGDARPRGRARPRTASTPRTRRVGVGARRWRLARNHQGTYGILSSPPKRQTVKPGPVGCNPRAYLARLRRLPRFYVLHKTAPRLALAGRPKFLLTAYRLRLKTRRYCINCFLDTPDRFFDARNYRWSKKIRSRQRAGYG